VRGGRLGGREERVRMSEQQYFFLQLNTTTRQAPFALAWVFAALDDAVPNGLGREGGREGGEGGKEGGT